MTKNYGAERTRLVEIYSFRCRVAVSKFGNSILLDYYSITDFAKLTIEQMKTENHRISTLIAPKVE